MQLVFIIMRKIVVMFILVLIGFLCAKFGMIDEAATKKLSTLSLKLVTPMLIFSSFQTEYDARIVKNLLLSFLMAAAAYVIQVPLALLLIKKKNNPDYQIERMAVIFANCGFFGIPLIQSLYGAEGAMYVTAYVTMFNVLLWSVGAMIMDGHASRKQLLKSLLSPAVIAMVLGLGCLLLRIQLPELIMEPIEYIAGMNTPFAMIVAGATLASTNILSCLKKPRAYWVFACKMLIVPLAVSLVLSRIPLDSMLVIIPILATSCPTGAAVTMFSVLYNKNAPYASQLFALNTLSSIVTIPLIFLFTTAIL